MSHQSILYKMINWVFGISILCLGILNLFLVHPVPGIVYLLLSLLFLPPVHKWLRNSYGVSIPWVFLILLGLVIFWFTLGVSDLGEMYGF